MTARASFVADVARVLVAYALLLAIENTVVGFGWSAHFVGPWEMAAARLYLTPIAFAAALPAALLSVLVARAFTAGRIRDLATAGALFGGLVAFGTSTGRHFANVGLRAGFVLFVGAGAGAVGWQLARRVPKDRPRTLALAGLVVGAVTWTADVFVLPRLYPAFHLALFALTLGAWALTALVLPRWNVLTGIAAVAVLAAALWSPRGARAVQGEDNLRRILVEHAPLLGRAVLVASKLAPPAPLDDVAVETTLASLKTTTTGRSLDWSGKDIVVVTIDALRADHLSSYGYGRTTSPNIDRLAARGARFERAYCPTPHTSYSVTSMMTGRYMRPLLSMGAGEDADTWATYMRRYGYRTGAFYPPAVFFIDEHRFRKFQREDLGFEYKKEEFAAPALRKRQIADYLTTAPKDKPLFLWVHLFEPHEPYVAHPEHPFRGNPTFDAYDSEIATADALVGDVVELVEASRGKGGVFIVSADHGEEHGDHGGNFHGTTVYEEQVRVPLVVVGPGISPHVVTTPVQTIDLLPTTLGALDVPTQPRIRGRDIGALASGKAVDPEGLAFAETDDYTLVARGSDRLVCERKIGSCTLFDIATDPEEKRPIVDRPARTKELRTLTAALERENGKVEASNLPDALRRGLQGDRDAAEDVAPLLDDANVEIRRTAGRCAFRIRAPSMRPQLERAFARDEDDRVRRWSALALARLAAEDADGGATPIPAAAGASSAEALVLATLRDDAPELRRAAALVLAERGDPRGEGELVARWGAAFVPGAPEPGEIDEARELLAAFRALKARAAVPVLTRSLEDVRLRPKVAEVLGDIGDPRAKAALLEALTNERYVHVRPIEIAALVKLGARDELLPPLTHLAGLPEPMAEAIDVVDQLDLLRPPTGQSWKRPTGGDLRVKLRPGVPYRVIVLATGDGEPLTGDVLGQTFAPVTPDAHHRYILEIGAFDAKDGKPTVEGTIDVRLQLPPAANPWDANPWEKTPDGGSSFTVGIRAIWVVPRVVPETADGGRL